MWIIEGWGMLPYTFNPPVPVTFVYIYYLLLTLIFAWLLYIMGR